MVEDRGRISLVGCLDALTLERVLLDTGKQEAVEQFAHRTAGNLVCIRLQADDALIAVGRIGEDALTLER